MLAKSACFQKNAGLCWESFSVAGSWPVTNSLTCTHNACFQGNAGLCWNARLFPWKFFSGWKLISHNVCAFFREMLDFADKVRRWMAADQSNVIAIHCKGGKGRTGTMICVWLIECGLFEGAKVMTLQWTLVCFFRGIFFIFILQAASIKLLKNACWVPCCFEGSDVEKGQRSALHHAIIESPLVFSGCN